MKKLEVKEDSCIFVKNYTELESRADGKFGEKAVLTQQLKGMDKFYSYFEIEIDEMNYVLEILKHRIDKNEFQIRIFRINSNGKYAFILGRRYIIKEEGRAFTNIFVNVLDNINENLSRANEKSLSRQQQIYIIEALIKHMWMHKL